MITPRRAPIDTEKFFAYLPSTPSRTKAGGRPVEHFPSNDAKGRSAAFGSTTIFPCGSKWTDSPLFWSRLSFRNSETAGPPDIRSVPPQIRSVRYEHSCKSAGHVVGRVAFHPGRVMRGPGSSSQLSEQPRFKPNRKRATDESDYPNA